MGNRFGWRSAAVAATIVAVGFLASGCDWSQLGGTSGHTGDNLLETAITPSNVPTLAVQFSASDGTSGPVAPQAEVSGILYATDADGVEAYSANGTTGCSGSPIACAPLWTYPTGPVAPAQGASGDVAVLDGVLYFSTGSALEAFDATGNTNCGGTPKVCQPLWSAPGSFKTPTVSNGTVYVTTSTGLKAFDAAGQTNCGGTPKVCSPVWTASGVSGVVTVAAGYAYALGGTGIVVLDASGSKGCTGSPKVCTPLWEYAPNYPVTGNYVVVSGSTLYADTFFSSGPMHFTGDFEAFDALGAAGCSGFPTVCAPEWTNSSGFTLNMAPLAGDNSEFLIAPANLGTIAYDSTGSVSSPGGYEYKIPGSNAVAIGGSVLYATDGTNLQAYDAGGHTGCSGSPVVCAPLWSAPGTDAIVANGTLFVSSTNASGDGEIVAYGLPG
jgi:hypothetical protein